MGAAESAHKDESTEREVLREYSEVERTLALLLDGLVGIADRVACVQSAFFEARETLPGSAEEYAQRNQTSKSNLYRLHKTARRRWNKAQRRGAEHLEPWQRVRNLVNQVGPAGLTTDAIIELSGLPEDEALAALASLIKTKALVRRDGRIRPGASLAVATERSQRRNLGLYLQGSFARIVRKRIAAAHGSDPFADGSAMGQGQRTVSMALVPELQRRIHEVVRKIADEYEERSVGAPDAVRFQHVIGTHTLDTPAVDSEDSQ